jgi:hypothetical protein
MAGAISWASLFFGVLTQLTHRRRDHVGVGVLRGHGGDGAGEDPCAVIASGGIAERCEAEDVSRSFKAMWYGCFDENSYSEAAPEILYCRLA